MIVLTQRDGELVLVGGRESGGRGPVAQVLAAGQLVVSGIHRINKPTSPTPRAGVSGGIVGREAPIQISNVAIYNSEAGRADRVGYKVEDGKKVRIYKSDGSAIDA
mgnify:CR=1 FL=1